MSFAAPTQDMRFVLRELADLDRIASLPAYREATPELVDAILEENARLVESVIAPLNWTGDQKPATLANGVVTTTQGFKEAFQAFSEGGWQGLQHPAEYGGQGLPKLVGTPCIENLNAANLSFALCPLLTDGAIEALLTAGSAEQQALYVPPMIEGRWTGTMNLTEPQAGSDLAQVRTRAVPQPDGTYRIFGQKIYITFGEHDMAENIVHLVLARTPDAPEGVKGISLFIVPKFMVGTDGSLGKRNDVWCTSIEHKLGIKASPTAVLIYGDGKGEVGEGAIGYRVGEENRGLEYMFVMMNAARFAVGLQGVAVAERAYQKAVAYARDRVQSRAVEGSPGPIAIIGHPDVRRMLMTMRALTEASRAVACVAASHHDLAHGSDDPATKRAHQAAYEYLVPIVKGFSTEMSLEVTSLGVQVHGGMGFIEETGAAQYYRDARILTIYEGTTAIQANDLVGRKTARDGGETARAFAQDMRTTVTELLATGDASMALLGARLDAAIDDYESVIEFVVNTYKAGPREVFAGSVPYLMLAGYVHGGWQMARAALACHRGVESVSPAFASAKQVTARFYADHLLTRSSALREAVLEGSAGTLGLALEQF